LEKFYNEKLSGVFEKSDDAVSDIPVAGEDLLVGMDLNIQKEAELVMAKLVANSRSESGTVIVQDPKTGKILAMGSLPNFDPNNYSAAKMDSYINPAVEKVYEPGSVFKVLTMAAGIDSGKITPDTTYNDTGSVKLSGYTIRNWDGKAHGKVTMTNIIEKSLNTGTAYAEKLIGHTIFADYIKKFGFGEKTGIDLPGEVRGDLRNINPKSSAVAFANAAFGQGVSVTPLQLITSISAIANGGLLMKPYLNLEIGSQEVRRVISEDTAKKVTSMMVSAVDKGKLASIEGYTVAGKTGTAQVPDLKRGGYTDRVIDTYTGFAPASNPRFTILIKIDEPEGAPLAGETVVPAFKELAKFLLQYYSVPPDRINN
jgi:cell division protein FtsI/penicillin-binding protein 2